MVNTLKMEKDVTWDKATGIVVQTYRPRCSDFKNIYIMMIQIKTTNIRGDSKT